MSKRSKITNGILYDTLCDQSLILISKVSKDTVEGFELDLLPSGLTVQEKIWDRSDFVNDEVTDVIEKGLKPNIVGHYQKWFKENGPYPLHWDHKKIIKMFLRNKKP